MSASPPIRAVVVNWNTREHLDRCLAALAADAAGGLVEVVVVDNASGDGSAELVGERHPWAGLIASGANLGFGGGANLGLEGSRSPWSLVLNADVELNGGALRRLLAAGEADPGAGILAPRLVSPRGVDPVFAFPSVLRTALEVAGMRRFPSRRLRNWIEYGADWDPERSGPIDWPMGAAILIRREAWAAAGGFDPDQFMYAEDLDLAWRVRRAGWRAIYVAEAIGAHAGGASTGQAFARDEGRLLVTRAYYGWVRRRRPAASFWAIAALNLAGDWARVAILAPAARLGRSGAREAQTRWARRARTDLRAIREERRVPRVATLARPEAEDHRRSP